MYEWILSRFVTIRQRSDLIFWASKFPWALISRSPHNLASTAELQWRMSPLTSPRQLKYSGISASRVDGCFSSVLVIRISSFSNSLIWQDYSRSSAVKRQQSSQMVCMVRWVCAAARAKVSFPAWPIFDQKVEKFARSGLDNLARSIIFNKYIDLLMINQYTLKFLSKEQEEKYLIHQAPKLLKEFFNFTLYTIVSYVYIECYSILNLVEFIYNGTHLYIGITSFTILMEVLLYLYIKRSVKRIDIILTFYQFAIAAVFKLDNFISPQEKSNDDYSWYFGFQCSILHYSVYLQGNNFLSQSGTVILIFVIHIYGSNLGSTSGIMNVLKFLFVFIILVSVKYTVTKLNKQQFIQNLEKQQFYELLQNQTNSQTLLLDLDATQDQINLLWANTVLRNKYKISDSVSARKFIRALLVEDQQKASVETLIRQILLNNWENYNINLKVRLLGSLNTLRLIQIQNQNHYVCLFILSPIKNKSKCLATEFMQIFTMNLLHRFLRLEKVHWQQNRKKSYEEVLLVNSCLSLLRMLKQKVPFSKQQISPLSLAQSLNELFGEENYGLTYNCPYNFCQNYQSILQLIIHLLEVTRQFNAGKLPYFCIQIEHSSKLTVLFKLSYLLNISQIPLLIDLFQDQNKNKIWSLKTSLNQLLEQTRKRLLSHHVAFNLVSIKTILMQISPLNYPTVGSSYSNLTISFEVYNISH